MNRITMMRRFLCGVLAMGLVGAIAGAADEKKTQSQGQPAPVPVLSMAGVVGETSPQAAVGDAITLPATFETGADARLAIAFAWDASAADDQRDLLLLGPNTAVRLVAATPVETPPKGFAPVVAEIARGAFRAVIRKPGSNPAFSVKAVERAVFLVDADVIATLDPEKDDATFLVRSGAITVKAGARKLRLKAGMVRTIEAGKVRGAKRFDQAQWEEAAALTEVPELDVSQLAPPPSEATRDESELRAPAAIAERPPSTSHEQPAEPVKEDYIFVKMTTSMGEIVLRLDRARAPISVANFLSYVEKDFYVGTLFHRVTRGSISVVQGGGFDASLQPKTPDAPIRNEWRNGLKNARGSIAVARRNQPDSGTSQFYINVTDNFGLDQPRGGAAYAVFGNVVRGMDVVDAIGKAATTIRQGMRDVPEENIVVTKVEVIDAESDDQ